MIDSATQQIFEPIVLNVQELHNNNSNVDGLPERRFMHPMLYRFYSFETWKPPSYGRSLISGNAEMAHSVHYKLQPYPMYFQPLHIPISPRTVNSISYKQQHLVLFEQNLIAWYRPITQLITFYEIEKCTVIFCLRIPQPPMWKVYTISACLCL